MLVKSISAQGLKPLLTDGGEIAFLDMREHGQYGEGHPFFSVPMPYSRLETLAAEMLPCKTVRLILMDDGDGVSVKAAVRLAHLGYVNLLILDGGAPAWSAAGYTLYKGVNVPSKTFGELLEHSADTPRITAAELDDLRKRDPSVIVLDGRSPAEFKLMSLPGALCCPNAELGYRLRKLVPDDSTTVVINCAGRTRSILGVEGLRLVNTANPLFALENGTQGWRLAGLELDHGQSAQPLPDPDSDELSAQTNIAKQIVALYQIERISPSVLAAWQEETERTTYLLDVRTREEYLASHWPNARHAPGGQLVQATDQYVLVRNARIVLNDDNQLRAATTAVRLKQMGHAACILDADASSGSANALPSAAGDTSATESAEQFAAHINATDVILDASPGMQYRAAHIQGAHWITRARIDELDVDRNSSLLVTGQDETLITGVVTDLSSSSFTDVRSCAGTPETWMDAGCTLESTPDCPSDDACIDYLFFVHDRHDGNLDAARRYLEWEVGLVEQLDAQERSVLNPSMMNGT